MKKNHLCYIIGFRNPTTDDILPLKNQHISGSIGGTIFAFWTSWQKKKDAKALKDSQLH